VSPTKYRNAAEALLRRLDKKGDVPSVSVLVDLGNLVSIRHRLPVAVIDADRVAGGAVTVRRSRGTERFDDLGGTEATHPEVGEVVFVDAAEEVVARRWCWRQSSRSAAGPSTTRLIIAVEAHHDEGETDVAAALASFEDLFARHLPAAQARTERLP
jgi:DNA/RNA-binding domain of Phe-tRNA-synthetase-like protein